MAMAESVIAAFECQVNDYRLTARETAVRRSECLTVDAAVARLQADEPAMVSSVDLPRLRQRLAGLGVA